MITAKVIDNIEPFSETEIEGLKIGNTYEVEHISMGSSLTHVSLKGIKSLVNSICLKFYENGKEIDIYSDKRFNPYL